MDETKNEAQEGFQDLETIMIPTENGEEEFAILDYFTYLSKKYIIVSPIVDDQVSEEVEIFRYKENGDKISLDIVDDKKTFNRIAEAYNKQMQ